jgi:hypothetical protein
VLSNKFMQKGSPHHYRKLQSTVSLSLSCANYLSVTTSRRTLRTCRHHTQIDILTAVNIPGPEIIMHNMFVAENLNNIINYSFDASSFRFDLFVCEVTTTHRTINYEHVCDLNFTVWFMLSASERNSNLSHNFDIPPRRMQINFHSSYLQINHLVIVIVCST